MSALVGADVVSRVVERGKLVYASALSPQPANDVKAQTERVLSEIDHLLALAGSGRSRLLTARIRLHDLSLSEAHEAAWREWLGAASRPVVAFTQAELSPTGTLVEILVTATK